MSDTIFALATAPGKAGVAVVRLSGPQAWQAVERIAGSCPPPRRAGLRKLRDANGRIMDEALVLTFAPGHSFTGEESAEFQLHGSVAIVNAVLAELASQPGLRPAEAGEFTRRALENDRLDITQVEGLADLIEAETEAQRAQAMAVFGGGIGRLAEALRADLTHAMALIEATIDFADEDVPVDVTPEVVELLTRALDRMSAEIDGVAVAERIRDGFEVAIVGRPNAGKSTLLNAIAGRDVVLTSEIAGTTRDVIELRADIRGLPVTFLDTAGLRGTEDRVEAMGVARAAERAAQADLRVFLVENAEEEIAEVARKPGDIVAFAKADCRAAPGFAVSGKTGQGVQELLDRVGEELLHRVARAGTATRQRHLRALSEASDHVRTALAQLHSGDGMAEVVAEELRGAVLALESLVGKVGVEDVLDRIFAAFCIGK